MNFNDEYISLVLMMCLEWESGKLVGYLGEGKYGKITRLFGN